MPGRDNASWRRSSSPGKDPWHREFRAYRERPLMEQALADLTGGNPGAAVEVLEEFALEQPDDLNIWYCQGRSNLSFYLGCRSGSLPQVFYSCTIR